MRKVCSHQPEGVCRERHDRWVGANFAVHHLPRAHASRAAVAWDGRQVRLLNSVPQNWRRPCTASATSTMHCKSKSCRKVPERTMTRSDIFKLVHGMRSKKHRERAPSYECLEKSDGSQEPSSNEDLGSRSRSGVNVCIFPCNNPIEHVIAECYRHAKHSRESSAAENSQSFGSEELSSSQCESLLVCCATFAYPLLALAQRSRLNIGP